MAAPYEENYLEWVKDAHAMEKQAESMLKKIAARLEHYPELKVRIQRHIDDTLDQQVLLQSVIDRYDKSPSVLKEVMGKVSALGQAMGVMLASDEVVKGAINGYVFEQYEIACYTSLIAAAERVGDIDGIRVFEQIREQEWAMAEWYLSHLAWLTDTFLHRSETDSVEAKK